MKVIIIAAIAANGVVGRKRKPCPVCGGSGVTSEPHEPAYVNPRDCPGCCKGCLGLHTVPANDLPWGRAYPEDLARFKATTMGHAVIAGRVTAEGMGKAWPLKGRTNCVVSGSMYIESLRRAVETRDDWKTGKGPVFPWLHGPGYILGKTLHEVIERLSGHGSRDDDRAYVIGGPRLWREALPIADELDLTLIDAKHDGDALFPWTFHQSETHLKLEDRVTSEMPQLLFECVFREPCPTNDELTFTRWCRR